MREGRKERDRKSRDSLCFLILSRVPIINIVEVFSAGGRRQSLLNHLKFCVLVSFICGLFLLVCCASLWFLDIPNRPISQQWYQSLVGQ